MKRKRRDLEIFSLSFLDVISCGLGAVVLLVLISKPNTGLSPTTEGDAISLLNSVMTTEERIGDLEARISENEAAISTKQMLINRLTSQKSRADAEAAGASSQEKDMANRLDGLELVKESLSKASVQERSSEIRDIEVGGIPVDSDYVIFIIDTSGSMKEFWPRVVSEVNNVLTIHPKITGFQILNDNGNHLLSGYQGRWIPDTPQRRRSALALLSNWNSGSSSSPVEGLEIAIRRYARPNITLSIYIFGDEYSGSSYDPVIDAVVRLNNRRQDGKPLAKIHAVGFYTNHTKDRFAILMREITRRSGGTFLALPR